MRVPCFTVAVLGVHVYSQSKGPPLTCSSPSHIASRSHAPMEAPLAKKRKKEGSASNYSPQDDCGPQPTVQPPPEPSPGVGTPQGK